MSETIDKEENWLRELCGNDTKLYEVLTRFMYMDPLAAISKEELQMLIEEAEKSDEDGNYDSAMQKYRRALDKAIFEATQRTEEKDRYIKVIQDLLAKISQATAKVKEKAEKNYVTSLERTIDYYKLLSERTEDVINVASLFYNERMDKLGEQVRREQRKEEGRDEDKKRRGKEETREEQKDKKRQKEKVEHRREEDRREKKEQEKEEETRKARKEKILEARREEEKGKTRTS